MGQSRTNAPSQNASRYCDQNRSTQTKRRDETSLRLRTLSPGIHLSFAQRHETFIATGQLAAVELASRAIINSARKTNRPRAWRKNAQAQSCCAINPVSAMILSLTGMPHLYFTLVKSSLGPFGSLKIMRSPVNSI